MKVAALLSLAALLICCGNKPCQPRMERLFIVQATSGDQVSFGHHVFVDGFDESCVDSLSVMSLVRGYCDTVTTGKPVLAVSLYRSLQNYIPGEQAQRWEEFRKDCIVHVRLNDRSSQFTIEGFTFYDANGTPQPEQVIWHP